MSEERNVILDFSDDALRDTLEKYTDGVISKVYSNIIYGIVPAGEDDDDLYMCICDMCGEIISTDVTEGRMTVTMAAKASALLGQKLCQAEENHE